VNYYGIQLTVSLNRIVSNTTQHSEFGGLVEVETLTHPGEEMSQAIVSSTDPFGNAGASTRE
jgi:hypothetical protein